MANIIYKRKGSGGADPKTSLQDRLLCLYPLSNLNKAMGASSIGALTSVNAPTTTTGKLGNCYQFNRTNNQKIHDPNNLLQISQCDQFTIGCWFQSTDNNTYAPPISFGRDAVAAFEVHGNRNINTNDVQWYISTDGITNKSVSWNGFVINTWFFILIEYSKKLGRFALYVDNILRSENLTVSTSANIVENTTRGLTFGAYARDLVNTSFHFSGLIDESFVALGNTTQEERDWLWNSGNGNTLV